MSELVLKLIKTDRFDKYEKVMFTYSEDEIEIATRALQALRRLVKQKPHFDYRIDVYEKKELEQ